MKITEYLPIVVLTTLACMASPAVAQQHLVFNPDKIEWKPAPASLRPGAQMAVLRGDPTQPGLFAMRLKFPAGYVVSPHWHLQDENVTVISGALLIGDGDKFDAARLEKITPGSLMVMPATHHHFARFDEDTVLQLNSIGPWVVNYVDPADDPRIRDK
jgi:ChrR-like protein with cupin domain